MIKISAITKAQWMKVTKAIGYSFTSSFLGTLLLVPNINALDERVLFAAVVSGVNAILVTIKQLVTEENKQLKKLARYAILVSTTRLKI